jgi:hypothetical protein
MPSPRKVLAATAGVAAAAGLAIAVRKKSRSGSEELREDAPGAEGARVFRVVRSGEGWAVELEGSSRPGSLHGTKREAVDAARASAHAAAPSGLVIHRADGTIQRHHMYDAG